MVESARMPQVWIYVVALTVLKLCGTEEVIADPDPSLCNEIGTGAPVVFIQGVREDITNGSVIDYVNLTGTPQQIDLRIKTPSEYLDFNSATRAIILKKPVDLDNSTNVPSIYIVLDCVVKGAQVLNIPVRVTVIVTDINDNAPIFLKPVYTVEISELTPVGTTIVTDILATDADKDNSFIEYSILPGPNSTYFDIPIPAQGKVTLNRSLDYDRGQRAMTVVIMAKDHPANGDPQFNTTVLLKVNITDGDDQNPKFLHPVYEGTVLENATRNTQVHMFTPIFAIDQDTGINTGVLYTIERSDSTDTGDSSYFYIDHRTGNIFVQKDTLFRGREFFFQVKATQQDNPDRNALAGVKIRVQASNVNPPKFLKDTYFATLVENVPIGTSVLTVSAKDMDLDGSQPQGSYLRYSLRPGKGSDKFQIGEQNGTIRTAAQIDYEEDTQITATVLVTDGNYTDTTLLMVTVINVNDNNPQVSSDSYHFNATSRSHGAVLGKLNATDADPMTSFVFEMGKYQELFQIDSRGWITILAHGENITQNSYTFSVKIFDDGIPPRQAITEVTLQFPPLPTMPAAAEVKGMAEGDYVLIYILGALVGILLIVLIVLLVYIKKRKSLNPEKQSNHINTSKAVRNYAPSLSPAESVNSDLHIDLDAMTTTMENPLALENPAFSFQYGTESTDEVDTTIRGVGEIEIGTAVAPYNENADSDNDSDSEMKPKTPNGDISSRNSIVSQNSIGNGSIHSSGPESLPNGIHKGSTQMLVQQEKANKAKKVKKLSWGKTRHMDSQTEIPLDPDVSVTPYDSSTDSLPQNAMQETADGKKPSITIYF